MKRPHSVSLFFAGGFCALLGVVCFVILAGEVRAALDELALIRSGEPIDGTVTDSGEYKSEAGENSDRWWIEYAYSVSGEALSGKYTDYTHWRVPDAYAGTSAPVELEYVPSEPSISRPLGTGAGSVASWVALRVSAVALILVVGSAFALVGFFLCFFQFYSVPLGLGSKGPAGAGEREMLRPLDSTHNLDSNEPWEAWVGILLFGIVGTALTLVPLLGTLGLLVVNGATGFQWGFVPFFLMGPLFVYVAIQQAVRR